MGRTITPGLQSNNKNLLILIKHPFSSNIANINLPMFTQISVLILLDSLNFGFGELLLTLSAQSGI